MWSRIHLIPLLQAEEDRDQVRRYYAQQAMEKELLGAETKAYHGDRYASFVDIGCLQPILIGKQLRSANVRSHSVTRYEVVSRV